MQTGSRGMAQASNPGCTPSRPRYPQSHSLSWAFSVPRAWRLSTRAAWLRLRKEKTATKPNMFVQNVMQGFIKCLINITSLHIYTLYICILFMKCICKHIIEDMYVGIHVRGPTFPTQSHIYIHGIKTNTFPHKHGAPTLLLHINKPTCPVFKVVVIFFLSKRK